nr:hypothetical protein [Ferrovum sp.]
MELKLTPEEVGKIVLEWVKDVARFETGSLTRISFNRIEFEASGYGHFSGAVLTYEEPKEGGKDE